jgi:hypothetical protein
MVEWALGYARAGLYVLPIWSVHDGRCECGKADCHSPGKHPHGRLLGLTGGVHLASIDEAQIVAWWTAAPDANIGIAMKRSGLIAFDIDKPQNYVALDAGEKRLGDLPDTMVQYSGSGNLHAIYRAPSFEIRGDFDDITLRANHYIVAAPSLHKSGKRYKWAIGRSPTEYRVSELPPAWQEALRRPIGVGAVGIPSEADEPEWLHRIPHDERIRLAREKLAQEKGEVKAAPGRGIVGDPPGTWWNVCRTTLRGYAIRDPEAGLQILLADYDPKCVPPFGPYRWAKQVRDVYDKATDPEWGACLKPHDETLRVIGLKQKPDIYVRPDQKAVTDEAEVALGSLGVAYVRGRTLVHVVRDHSSPDWLRRPDGAPVIAVMKDERIRELLGDAARWLARDNNNNLKPAMVPPWVVKTLLSRDRWSYPPLEGIVDAPVFRPDGSVLDVPGYDRATRLIFDPRGTTFPPIPARPDQTAAANALAEVMEPYKDFPFITDFDRSAAAAFLLSIIGRPAIDGCVPLFYISAPTPGTGKGLLGDTTAIIATGREAPKISQTRDDEEWRKRLLTIALEGDPIAFVDNAVGEVGSGPLAMALTAGIIKDRLLGHNRDATATLRAVFGITGNNLSFSHDLGRRVVEIGLDPRMEHPEDRAGLRDLVAYVRAERPRLVAAALTILRGHVLASLPSHGKPPKGSFEHWDRLVRGAIIWAGGADPLGAVSRIREGGDADLENLGALLRAWHKVLDDREVTVGEVIEAATAPLSVVDTMRDSRVELRDALMTYGSRGGQPDATAISYKLRGLKSRIVGGLVLTVGEKTKTGKRWRVTTPGAP